jgi:hypothetical protein
MTSQNKHKSVLPDQSIPGAGQRPQTSDGFEMPTPPRYFFDASLLFRCMDLFQLDRSDLAREDPLLFRELQSMCALCLSKEECAQDLAHEFDNARWTKWRGYCPNSAMLRTLWRDAIIGQVEAEVPLRFS